MQLTCTRKFHICAGHRVLGHEGKCAHPHGHNYTIFVEAEQWPRTTQTDDIGRVIDFSVLKDKVGAYLESAWDHGFIVYEKDSEMLRSLRSVVGAKIFEFPFNPTAENMARFLLNVACPAVLVGMGVRAVRVVVHETDNCEAEARL